MELVATNSDPYEFCGPAYFSMSLQDERCPGHFLEVSCGVDLNEALVATVQQVHRGLCLLHKNIYTLLDWRFSVMQGFSKDLEE